MALMSANLFGNPSRKMTMIGVTGTKGKTTTTHMIKSVLEAAGRKVGMIGTNGIYYMGRHKDTANTTPHKVCSDESLQDLVRFTPAEDIDLSAIYGLGPVRIGQYGNDILALCRPFADSLNNSAKQQRELARRALQQEKGEENYKNWAEGVRARAFVELRAAPEAAEKTKI